MSAPVRRPVEDSLLSVLATLTGRLKTQTDETPAIRKIRRRVLSTVISRRARREYERLSASPVLTFATPFREPMAVRNP